MTVVEVRGRGGQLLERFRSHALTLRIGRAFDNDLILEDEHVCAHHLRLSRVEGGWRFQDLDSLNGLRRRGRVADDGILHSGDELRIGHTILRVYDEEHPVEPAMRLTGAEATLAALGRRGVWLVLAAASVVVSAVGLFWSSVEEFELLPAVQPLMMGIMETCVVAAAWAFVGRLLRHRTSFIAHFSLWLTYGLLGVLTTFVAHTVAFNASDQRLEAILEHGLSFAVLGFVIWGSLTLATNLRGRNRLYAALGVAAIALVVEVAGQFQFQTFFFGRPDYYARLQNPSLLFAEPASESQLLQELPALFDRADAELDEDSDDPAKDSAQPHAVSPAGQGAQPWDRGRMFTPGLKGVGSLMYPAASSIQQFNNVPAYVPA
jgi:hypothetical protein